MNLSVNSAPNKELKLDLPSKATKLNPNAAEFVPSSLRSTQGNAKSPSATKFDFLATSKKAILDRSESSISNGSETFQLPDDITPDFRIMVEESDGKGNLSLKGLSIHEGTNASNHLLSTADKALTFLNDNLSFRDKIGFSQSTYGEEQLSASMMNWDEPLKNGGLHSMNGTKVNHYNGDSVADSVNDLIGGSSLVEDAAINPLKFLSSKFPGFPVQSIADVYYKNGRDLRITVGVLSYLENQVGGTFVQSPQSKSFASPSLGMPDFPALAMTNTQHGLTKYSKEDVTYKSPNITRGDFNLVSSLGELASPRATQWRYKRDGSNDNGVGSSRSSQLLASTYGGNANLYLESREDARDFSHLRNASTEQARQAYLIGNKALAKELNLKDQLYNLQMKATHDKAREATTWQRNLLLPDLHVYSKSVEEPSDPFIDLRGLHAGEAIHALNHELRNLKRAARLAPRKLEVMILVGSAAGGRALSAAVEQCLSEHGLHHTPVQPGVLRVVMY
ncbi:Polyadenylate-binding protein-interacting protein 7 [Ananas comosus]|uniref:Polyadenylate-binding protein-interacting protein 7 n=1 Tax=Ananas comosus TaxID=4615 RepID=A0A199VX32_ANACO|nr:Polyadenylate-binding protein-interacting protein 7 [Ananas comosus]